jgi:phytoene dehydrogenase-like protein
MSGSPVYDVIIVGAGHNGLIAACYLGLAGKSVLVLEKNEVVGGATLSKKVFPGVDARISVYSYLISLLPQKILKDLNIPLEVRRRLTASYTPMVKEGRAKGLLISNDSERVTRQSFYDFTGNAVEYQRYRELQEMLSIFAQKIWPTLLSPLPSKQELSNQFKTPVERQVWEYLIEKPLSHLIEDYLADDLVRGLVFTDAKIGVSTYPQDPSLLQNKTFLYHIIGQGNGEWRVPVGGMGALVDALRDKVQALRGTIVTEAEVVSVHHSAAKSTVHFKKMAVKDLLLLDLYYSIRHRISPIAACLAFMMSSR